MKTVATVLVLPLLCVVVLGQEAATHRSERIVIKSEAVGRDVVVVVHLPASYDQRESARYPVIYFLHGAGRGSEKTWEQRGTMETVARLVKEEKLPEVIVVCPRDAARMSFYVNWKGQEKERHADFVSAELPAFIDAKYRTRSGRRFRALTGDSMGGYGALVNAMRKPSVFGSVSAHEPAIYPEDVEALPSWIRSGRRGRVSILGRLFGDPIDQDYWLKHNVFHIARTAKAGAFKDLPIYFDVGERDRYGLYETCPAFSKLLTEKEIEHTFHLRSGGHGARFFAESVPSSLEFHGRHFAAAMKAAEGKEKDR